MAERRRVGPEAYGRDYLLSDDTEGYQEFQRGEVSYTKQIQLDLLEFEPGAELLEVGVGRGEFLAACARKGARASGIDFSPDAIEIARQTMAEFEGTDLRVADCKDLPFDDASFDVVFSGDVLEHQDFEDGIAMLHEMRRVVRPGGYLLVHTAPNTVFTRVVYPVARPFLRLIDPKTIGILEEHMEVNRGVHVHEYSWFSLRRVARAAELGGARVWIAPDVLRSAQHRHTQTLSKNPLVKLAGWLGRFGPFRFLLGNDLFLRWERPAEKS